MKNIATSMRELKNTACQAQMKRNNILSVINT